MNFFVHRNIGMIIYGLLHLESKESSAHNVKVKDFEDQIEVYFKNAITLSESLKFCDINFSLLTNDKLRLESISHKWRRNINLIEIPFSTRVPSGLKFYSAHFKIDAIKYIATLNDDYAIICDIDVVCINKLPLSMLNIINREISLFYDISDQVIPAYGRDVIIQDISILSGIAAQGRWAGGEFLGGRPAFFEQLHKTIQSVWPRYLLHSKMLHHVGDEALISAALEIMVDQGEIICDAGTLGIISRFWSGNIKHQQRPLAHYSNSFLLHLPADKRLLAGISEKNMPNFLANYTSHVKKRRIYNFLGNLAARWRGPQTRSGS